MNTQMKILKKGSYQGLLIHPRWPARHVLVSPQVFQALCNAQSELPEAIKLILTRGYEAKQTNLGLLRRFSRFLGILIFKSIYPKREKELGEIFGSNGHDVDGNHVDVSFSVLGKRLKFLPLSVFTPLSWQKRRKERSEKKLRQVKFTLMENGFKIHSNETESLQIHCDFQST